MRSIRLSLTLYFLVLLALSLGAVSVLVYRTVTATLAEKQQAAAQFLESKYQEDCVKEQQSLRRALFAQAQTVAREVQFRSGHEVMRFWSVQSLGVIPASQGAFGNLAALPWALEYGTGWGEKGHNEFNRSLIWRYMSKPSGMGARIALDPSDFPRPIDSGVREYFQINSAWGAKYLSPSLRKRTFAFDPGVFAPKGPVIDVRFDDVLLGDTPLARVTLLAPAARFVPLSGPRGRGGKDRRGSSREDPPRNDSLSEMWTRPALCIQYACEVTRRDAALAALKGDLSKDLENLNDRTADSLALLRNRLLIINGLCFGAVLLGAFWLVRLGLSPLHRLGEAVSRVSERDFSLHFDQKRLPRELSPIVERLTTTLEELRRAFGREKQATADISHELRTPLAALMTTIDVTLRKPRSSEEYREALEDCRASGQQINQAVERLLALARLDAGTDRLRSQNVDATEVVRQCVSVVRPLAEAHGLRVQLNAEGSTSLVTDPDKLREILNNLLHNAIQYNRPNGLIDVAVHRQNGHLHLAVRDSGIGIPENARPHIFERFFRADPSRQADGMQTGLGLAIVNGYLDLMGWTIQVDSTEGEGSTFLISLPA
jgi:heavy metal sensor kinase